MSIKKDARVIYMGRNLARKMNWVCEAISADSNRPAICGLCINVGADGTRLVGTDGQRLHVAEVDAADAQELPPAGAYRVLRLDPKAHGDCVALVRLDVTYPDWRAVIPKGGRSDTGIISRECTEMALFRLMKTVDAPLRLRFIDSLVTFGGDWALTYTDATSPLVFTNTTGETAVIMPLRSSING
jgi:hypothetical protein